MLNIFARTFMTASRSTPEPMTRSKIKTAKSHWDGYEKFDTRRDLALFPHRNLTPRATPHRD